MWLAKLWPKVAGGALLLRTAHRQEEINILLTRALRFGDA
jgi:hypothetical protein